MDDIRFLIAKLPAKHIHMNSQSHLTVLLPLLRFISSTASCAFSGLRHRIIVSAPRVASFIAVSFPLNKRWLR